MLWRGIPVADAEVIALALQVLETVGIKNISLEINSIGCPECRKNYTKALREYFASHIDTLCETCKDRLERNPMRILDCKSPVCASLAKDAPKVIDFLCDECQNHFDGVKAHLDAAHIKYTVNPQIVRGLDYYTKTVFEFVSGDVGAQSTVCGGGRYDGLVAQMGGPSVAALGFGMGIERLMLALENQNADFPEAQKCDLYIAAMGDKASLKATELCQMLRHDGFEAQCDVCGRGLKAQMKYSDKIGACFCVVLGDNELDNSKCNVKNMKTGEIKELSLDNFAEQFMQLKLDDALNSLEETII